VAGKTWRITNPWQWMPSCGFAPMAASIAEEIALPDSRRVANRLANTPTDGTGDLAAKLLKGLRPVGVAGRHSRKWQSNSLKLVRLPFRHFRKWECPDRSEWPTLANDSSTARNCPPSIWDWSGDDNRR